MEFNKTKYLVLSLFLVISLGLISAVGDTQINVNQDRGLEISYPKYTTIKTGEPFNLSFHTYNISNGVEITQANCSLMIYNQTGERVGNENLSVYTSSGFNRYLNEGNFSITGKYNFNIYCYRQLEDIGGFADGIFSVTPSGLEVTTPTAIAHTILLFGMIFFLLVMIVGSVVLPWRNFLDGDDNIVGVNDLKYLKLFCIVFSYIFAMWVVGIMYSISTNYLFFTGTETFFNFIYQVMLRMIYPVIIVGILIFIFTILEDKKIASTLKRVGEFKG